MIDKGHVDTDPLVLIPGIQGRWEWMAPTIEALAQRHRVLTFLARRGERRRIRVRRAGSRLIDRLIDRAAERRATRDRRVVRRVDRGAVRRAASRSRRGARAGVDAVAAVAARLGSRQSASKYPRADAAAVRDARMPRALAPEMFAARARWPSRAAARRSSTRGARLAVSALAAADGDVGARLDGDRHRQRLPRVTAPTLVITGEPLDRVVPVESTLEYLELIPGARHVVLPGTGHIGLSSKPREFAARGPVLWRISTEATLPGRRDGRVAMRIMNVDLPGPAGRARGAARRAGAIAAARARSSSRIRTRSRAARCTRRRSFRARKASRASAAPCCGSTSAASGRARARSTRARARWQDFRAALDFMAARYPGDAALGRGVFVRLVDRARDRRGRRRACRVLIGIAPPVKRDGYSFARTLETTKPKFLVQGDLDELCPLKDMWAFYAKLKEPKELVVIDGANHLFDGKTRGSRRRARGAARETSR